MVVKQISKLLVEPIFAAKALDHRDYWNKTALMIAKEKKQVPAPLSPAHRSPPSLAAPLPRCTCLSSCNLVTRDDSEVHIITPVNSHPFTRTLIYGYVLMSLHKYTVSVLTSLDRSIDSATCRQRRVPAYPPPHTQKKTGSIPAAWRRLLLEGCGWAASVAGDHRRSRASPRRKKETRCTLPPSPPSLPASPLPPPSSLLLCLRAPVSRRRRGRTRRRRSRR